MGRPTVDILGRRFGCLTAVERVVCPASGPALWLCRCDCGGTKVMVGSKLRKDLVKSCGCLSHLTAARTQSFVRDELQLAWAAGFFDGEGSVFVNNNKRSKGGTTGKMYSLVSVDISVAQVRREPLDRFHAAVGIGTVNGPYAPRSNQQPHFRFNASGRPSVLHIATALWPYLSQPKREQFHRCWDDLRSKTTRKSPVLLPLPKLDDLDDRAVQIIPNTGMRADGVED